MNTSIWRTLTLALVLIAGTASHGALLGGTTDLNLANQAELEMVKGIGPQLSERILAERTQRRFDNWDDFVARMKGLGPSHATRLSAAGLRIDGEAYAGNAAPPGGPAK